MPGASYERSKEDKKKSFAYVWEYLKKEKSMVRKGLVSLVCSLLIDLSVPIYVGIMTDELKNYQAGTVTEAEAT